MDTIQENHGSLREMPTAPSHNEPRSWQRFRPRIALAEDDPDLRSGLTALLQDEGYLVDTFASGAELVEHLASAILNEEGASRPDVIVTDVQMPGFNGLIIAEGLRDNGWITPLIVISGFTNSGMQERVDRLGGAALFSKPFDLRAFERKLDELLAAAIATH